ncbi:IPT/TIG domain-containing protein [Actinoplanes sp. NPDC051513]|uniref:IPT/TIG domain-containing protein n=1 Tax=Actinoplanes sp. NPDC051513 TaxID=3363908 RepID=UPI0037A1CCB3
MPTPRFVRSAIAAGTASVVTLAGLAGPATPAFAAATMTLNTATGPSGGGNTVIGTIATTSSYPSPIAAGTVPNVQFQYFGLGSTACDAAPETETQIDGSGLNTSAGALTVDPEDVYRLSGTRVAFTVPTGPYPELDGNNQPSTINTEGLTLLPSQTTAKWFVCVYDSVSNVLIASTSYTLAVRPTITSIVPNGGPALGGQTITVNGTGFFTGATATVGGVALTEVKVSPTGTSLTGTTPAHAPGAGQTVSVTTTGGTVESSDPDNNGQPQDNDVATDDAPRYYTFTNGIVITPDTAPAESTISVDIQGAALGSLIFDTSGLGSPTDATAHIFLVKDAYDPGSNRGVQECTGIVPIGDGELICTLDLSSSLDPTTSAPQMTPVAEGTYTLTVVATGDPLASAGDAAASIVSSNATFTVASY